MQSGIDHIFRYQVCIGRERLLIDHGSSSIAPSENCALVLNRRTHFTSLRLLFNLGLQG